jgi:hypothetical protein
VSEEFTPPRSVEVPETEPVVTEPIVTEPVEPAIDPGFTPVKSEVTEPQTFEQSTWTDPPATEPEVVTEPVVTEPISEPIKIKNARRRTTMRSADPNGATHGFFVTEFEDGTLLVEPDSWVAKSFTVRSMEELAQVLP